MSDSNKYNNDSIKDETDLSGMDLASAKEYVMAYITTLRQTQSKMKEIAGELALWQQRISFSRERGRADLAAAAEMKVKEISEILSTLVNEEKDIAVKVSTLMKNLKKLKAGFIPTVDAERLQAELEMITGEKDELAEKFKEEETLAELEKLKQKLKDEGSVE